jgi:hypothetical protein
MLASAAAAHHTMRRLGIKIEGFGQYRRPSVSSPLVSRKSLSQQGRPFLVWVWAFSMGVVLRIEGSRPTDGFFYCGRPWSRGWLFDPWWQGNSLVP